MYSSHAGKSVGRNWISVFGPLSGIIAVLLFGLPAAEGQIEPNHARGQNFEINITKAYKLNQGGNTAPVFKVEYNYKFTDRNAVRILGLGEVPATGAFTYIVQADTLEFSQVEGVPFSIVVPFRSMRAPEGAAPEVVREDQFGNAGFNELRERPGALAVIVSSILNQSFPDGYEIKPAEGQNKYISTYRDLTGIPVNTRAQVAVLISHPTDAQIPIKFEVHYLARQRPKKSSDWEDEIDSGVQNAAKKFVDDLVAEIKNS